MITQRAGGFGETFAPFGLFCGLNGLPIRGAGFAVMGLCIAKDMRMAANQLVSNSMSNRVKIEALLFLSELGMEHHLQKQIA